MGCPTLELIEQRYKELKNRSFSEKPPTHFPDWEKLLRNRLLDHLPAGVALLDKDFRLLHHNRCYSEYVSIYSPYGTKIKGRVYFDYMPGSQRTLLSWFRSVRDEIRSDSVFDFHLPLAYEQRVMDTYWDANVSTLVNKRGNRKGVLIFCIDTTSQVWTQLRLRRQKEQIDQLLGELQELKTAVKVLTRLRDEDRAEIECRLMENATGQLLPLVQRIKPSLRSEDQRAVLGLIEAKLRDLSSPFSLTLKTPAYGLTQREAQVAGLIRAGCASKEIADLLGVSPATIDYHRRNIRKKLGLSNRKLNLSAHLASLAKS